MATVKAVVKLAGGTVTLTADGTKLLNTEVETRAAWYATHTTGTPRKPYTPVQYSALNALEKAKVALVSHLQAANFKEAARLVGYTPTYAPRRIA